MDPAPPPPSYDDVVKDSIPPSAPPPPGGSAVAPYPPHTAPFQAGYPSGYPQPGNAPAPYGSTQAPGGTGGGCPQYTYAPVHVQGGVMAPGGANYQYNTGQQIINPVTVTAGYQTTPLAYAPNRVNASQQQTTCKKLFLVMCFIMVAVAIVIIIITASSS